MFYAEFNNLDLSLDLNFTGNVQPKLHVNVRSKQIYCDFCVEYTHRLDKKS